MDYAKKNLGIKNKKNNFAPENKKQQINNTQKLFYYGY